jgi:hypothetical protein
MSTEYVLQRALINALELLQTQPDAVRDFLGLLAEFDAEKYGEARDFFANNQIEVRLSYPTNPPPTNSVVVALVLGPESQNKASIGGYIGDELEETPNGDPISLTQYFGITSRVTFQLIVFAFNADLCIWAAKAIRWALLAQKDILHELGLTNHQIGMQDWRPDNQWQPDLVLRRVVSFTCDEVDFVSIGYGRFIKAINVTVEDPPTTFPQFIDS